MVYETNWTGLIPASVGRITPSGCWIMALTENSLDIKTVAIPHPKSHCWTSGMIQGFQAYENSPIRHDILRGLRDCLQEAKVIFFTIFHLILSLILLSHTLWLRKISHLWLWKLVIWPMCDTSGDGKLITSKVDPFHFWKIYYYL